MTALNSLKLTISTPNSHESNTDMWRHASDDRWKKEMVGLRAMLGPFGGIPAKEVVGHRAPFLQTAGNTTFQVNILIIH